VRTITLEQEREIEANLFAIELILAEHLFKREVDYALSDPKRVPEMRGCLDLLDDPAVAILAKKFVVTEQLIVIRLCMLGYFQPYVKGGTGGY